MYWRDFWLPEGMSGVQTRGYLAVPYASIIYFHTTITNPIVP